MLPKPTNFQQKEINKDMPNCRMYDAFLTKYGMHPKGYTTNYAL